jgi:tetratricopeptide (TPR) repeat protein
MAKKRPHPRREPRRHRRRAESPPLFPTGFFDRRAIEGAMWDGLEEAIGLSTPDTPLKRAQAIVYRAFGRLDPAERVRMAREALAISPDCADAHVLLAEHARTAREAMEHYELGVAAGERALDPDLFREEVGHFWGILETRPYMRAREGLAQALSSAGRKDRAIEHLREMLRLNPNDNQGIRFTLVSWLLTLGRDDEVKPVLERYHDAAWNSWFTRALISFRRQGDTHEGRRLLRIGDKSNPFILPWLLGDDAFPQERPTGYTPRSPEEAYFYVEGSRCAWRSTPGAIAWLRTTLGQPEGPPGPTAESFRPEDDDQDRLALSPQSSEIWQAGFRRIPKWMKGHGERVVPWIALVGNPGSDKVVGSLVLTKEPGASDLWDAIVKAIERPAVGRPRRPDAIEVRPDPRWDELRPFLDDLGIELRECETLEVLDEMFDDLTARLLEDEPPRLLDMPRVTPEIVGGLFRAAADFYRKAPWRILGDRYGILIECPRFDSGPWAAVVMGQAGLTLGLALYDRIEQLRALWVSEPDEQRELTRQMASLVLTFDPESQVHPMEVDAADGYGWEVVDPEAFPSVYRKEPGLSLRPPLSWELVLLEGCLRAIPAFLSRHLPGDDARSEMTVPVATGELDLILSWVGEPSTEAVS